MDPDRSIGRDLVQPTGEARVALPRAARVEGAHVQVLVFDATHTHTMASLPARELSTLAAQASGSKGFKLSLPVLTSVAAWPGCTESETNVNPASDAAAEVNASADAAARPTRCWETRRDRIRPAPSFPGTSGSSPSPGARTTAP